MGEELRVEKGFIEKIEGRELGSWRNWKEEYLIESLLRDSLNHKNGFKAFC